MREIKFRGWHKNIMISQFLLSGNSQAIYIHSGGNIKIINDVIPMQYTGLKDKNGKEIYEGDIFRQEKETDDGDIRNYLVVMWINQRGAFYLVEACHLPILENNDCENEPEFSWLFQDANLYDFSIDVGLDLVGNIYENPELIK